MCSQGERKASTLCVPNRVKDINKCDEKVGRENRRKSSRQQTENKRSKKLNRLISWTHSISSRCSVSEDETSHMLFVSTKGGGITETDAKYQNMHVSDSLSPHCDGTVTLSDGEETQNVSREGWFLCKQDCSSSESRELYATRGPFTVQWECRNSTLDREGHNDRFCESDAAVC